MSASAASEINVCQQRIEELEQQLAEARAFAEEAARRHNELLADRRILRCAFCNTEYPPATPPTQHEALTAHVRVCSQHPMREVERQRDGAELAGRLAGLRLARETALGRRYRTAGEAAITTLLALADDIDDLIDEAKRTMGAGAGG